MPASNFASADAVLGVDNFVDQGGMTYPVATNCAPNMFVVTNQQNFYGALSYTGFSLLDSNTVVTTEKIAYDCALQGDSNPTDVAIYGGKLLIADPAHNRIRTWSSVPNDPRERRDPNLAFGVFQIGGRKARIIGIKPRRANVADWFRQVVLQCTVDTLRIDGAVLGMLRPYVQSRHRCMLPCCSGLLGSYTE